MAAIGLSHLNYTEIYLVTAQISNLNLQKPMEKHQRDRSSNNNNNNNNTRMRLKSKWAQE